MQINGYLNLTTHRLTSTLSGGTPMVFPSFVRGDDVRFSLRLSENIDGVATVANRTVTTASASLSIPGAKVSEGKFVLRVGVGPYVEGDNQTAPVAFDADALEVSNALSAIGLSCVVKSYDSCWLVSVNDGENISGLSGVSVDALDDKLVPESAVLITKEYAGEQVHYVISLRPLPIAFTSGFEIIVPPAPSFSEVQAGGEVSGVTWSEIQALYLPPNFQGTYQIRRGYRKSVELSSADGPEEILAAIAPLADDGGSFSVTNPAANIAHITFLGEMSGVDQDLLEIEVFSAPPGDLTVSLDLKNAEVVSALRDLVEVKATLEIEVVVEDPSDDSIHQTVTAYRGDVLLVRDDQYEGLEAAAGIDWLKPPYGRSYTPFTEDQIIHGTRNYVAPFGNGVDTAFVLSHNLDSLEYLPPAVVDNTTGALLIHGTDYLVTGADANTITLETLAEDPWPTDGLKIILGLVGPASAFQAHNHTIAQIESLQGILDDLGSRVEDLEDILPAFASTETAAAATGPIAEWDLPTLFELYPSRVSVAYDTVAEIKQEDLPRVGGLLPAAYFTGEVTEVTELPGSPTTTDVYQNTGTEDLYLTGYLGRRSFPLEPDGYFVYDGRGFYAVEKVTDDDNVFYPVDFVRELFRIPVNEKQLRVGKTLFLDFSLVAAVMRANVAAQWGVVIDIGVATAEGVASPNIFDVDFLPPTLDQTFMLTGVPSSHNFGLRIVRKLVDSADTLLVDKVTYGAVEATDTGESLSSANFVIRARLHRFDTQDNKTDPRGLVAFNGLDATLGNIDSSPFGKAIIN